MRDENTTAEEIEPEEPLSEEERAEELRILAEWFCDRIKARVRIDLKLHDLERADAFLERLRELLG